jgi:hypothetical protein
LPWSRGPEAADHDPPCILVERYLDLKYTWIMTEFLSQLIKRRGTYATERGVPRRKNAKALRPSQAGEPTQSSEAANPIASVPRSRLFITEFYPSSHADIAAAEAGPFRTQGCRDAALPALNPAACAMAALRQRVPAAGERVD